jgi:hypothetical protein
MAKVQQPSDSKCYTPWPEPFRIWEENRITRELRELDWQQEQVTKPLHEPQGAPYSTREAQFKYSSNRNVIQAALVV